MGTRCHNLGVVQVANIGSVSIAEQVKDKEQLRKVFKAYDAAQRLRTQKLVKTSRDTGYLYGFQK